MSKLRANQITNKASTGAPTAPNGLVVTGVTTSTTFSGSGSGLTGLTDSQIPNLNASKITAGTLPTTRGGTGLASLGTAGQSLKVNSSANGFEFGSGGGVLGMNQTITSTHHAISMSTDTWTATHNDFAVTYTAKSTTSHFLLEAFLSLGSNHHDFMGTCNWWDSLKGLSNGNELFELSGAAGSRKRGTFALFPSGAGVSAAWDDYWFSGVFISALYYPAAGQRSTSQRTFKPVFRRNGYNFNLNFNYSEADNSVSLTGTSIIRVTEIDGGIVG